MKENSAFRGEPFAKLRAMLRQGEIPPGSNARRLFSETERDLPGGVLCGRPPSRLLAPHELNTDALTVLPL